MFQKCLIERLRFYRNKETEHYKSPRRGERAKKVASQLGGNKEQYSYIVYIYSSLPFFLPSLYTAEHRRAQNTIVPF